MVRRGLFAVLAPTLAVGCSLIAPLSDLRVSAGADAAADARADAGAPMGDGGPVDGGERRFCEQVDAEFCEDFDVPDGGLSRWPTTEAYNGGSLAVDLGGTASSPPGFLRAQVAEPGAPSQEALATARVFLKQRSVVRFRSKLRFARRPSAGAAQTHDVYGVGVPWGVFLEATAIGDALVEEYFANGAYHRNWTLCSSKLDAAWTEVETAVDLAAGSAEVFYGGVSVAKLTLVAVPSTTMALSVSVGFPWVYPASAVPMVEVDDVVVP